MPFVICYSASSEARGLGAARFCTWRVHGATAFIWSHIEFDGNVAPIAMPTPLHSWIVIFGTRERLSEMLLHYQAAKMILLQKKDVGMYLSGQISDLFRFLL